jgi:hypothetical protein
MLFCTSCGFQEADVSRYCSACGTPIATALVQGNSQRLASSGPTMATVEPRVDSKIIESRTTVEGRRLTPEEAGAKFAERLNLSLRTRRHIVNGAVVALVILGVFAGERLFKETFSKFGESAGSTDASAPSQDAADYVRAGGWICNTAIDAVGYSRLSQFNVPSGFSGCTQIGRDLRVNILERTSLAGTEIVNVGNSGGAGWTIEGDIR